MHEKTFKLLWQMDSTCKWSTADVGPLKGQAKKVQGADEDTETIIAEEGKNTAGKPFILSVR